ncbi:MAG: ThiF family adenylyltransferase [Planctomycetota bacterium]|nr:ThiF family adenylyltransferase [Planctomycetota bacterium]
MRVDLKPDDDGRFSRFELISWWDQPRLQRSKVLVIGAGALGNELIKNSALIGIGNLLVADMDLIERSNLTRAPLYREEDRGQYKAEVACRAAKTIYPEMKTQPFVGNVVHDLGLGVYFWADVILGGLDNREARVAINAASLFAGKTWIDGAIEVLNGVARVFAPGDGACYECTMSDVDWKLLESRRSCALLTREQIQEGKVPTTPTTSSIVAAFQMQEAIKHLHGMETIAGKGFVFNGLACDTYIVTYTRKPDCFAHDRFERLEPLGAGVKDITLGELLARARKELGPEAVLSLARDLVTALACPSCQTSEPCFRVLGKVTEKEGRCPKCGEMRAPETTTTLGLEPGHESASMADLGIPPYDVITAREGERTVSYLFDGDAAQVLGPLAAQPS